MCRSSFVFAAAFCFVATITQAAGVRFFDVSADGTGPTLTGAAWYPCAAPQQTTGIDGRLILGTKDCPIFEGKFPLIIISHGRAGWFGGHHDTAAALADAGFVVAAINHPGDTSTDKSHVDDLSVFLERPLRLCQIGPVEALGEPAVDRPSPYSGDMHHGVVILALQVSTDRVAGDICRRAVVIDLEVAADRIGVYLNSGSVISDGKLPPIDCQHNPEKLFRQSEEGSRCFARSSRYFRRRWTHWRLAYCP